MLTDSKAFSGFAVDDLERTRDFYEKTLGIQTTLIDEAGLLTLHLAGDRDTFVYQKPDFEPATYTILNFPVADVDAAVDELTMRGVEFEQYEGSNRTTRASLAVAADRPSRGSRTRPATSCRCSTSPRTRRPRSHPKGR